MDLHEYDSYREYVDAQTEANVRKLDWVWVREESIRLIAEHASSYVTPRGEGYRVLCHGTRRGVEQRYFREYLDVLEVLGTEISHTAEDFQDTIQWDFHDVRAGWEGAWDVVYSNALDHSYAPVECVRAWISCLTDSGLLYVERDGYCDRSTETDPFGATEEEWDDLFAEFLVEKFPGDRSVVYVMR